MAEDKKSQEALEQEVWGAISAFEQILEAMPNDRASLEALVYAYEQIGDLAKVSSYTVRLGKVMLDECDYGGASKLTAKLEELAAEDSEAADLLIKIKESAVEISAIDQQSASVVESTTVSKVDTAKILEKGPNIDDELSLAWNLSEAGEVTQEEYANVVQDLTEMSAGESSSTISVLHVLEARAFKSLERIMGFLAKLYETPIIVMSNFDMQKSVIKIMPFDFMIQRGVVPFEKIGESYLIAVMNPYSQQLRKDVESLVGKKCYFYMTLSSEFERSLERISEMLKDELIEE